MKVLTLHQPWASLVAIGAKKIETRSWQTSYRGLLGIHAGKRYDHQTRRQCLEEPFLAALKRAGYLSSHELPLGKIIAVCRLTACLQIPPVTIEWRAEQKATGERLPHLDRRLPPEEPELSFGDYRAGRYAWFLQGVRRLQHPIAVNGWQRLWNYETTTGYECDDLGICKACGEELPINAAEFGGFCDPLCVEIFHQ